MYLYGVSSNPNAISISLSGIIYAGAWQAVPLQAIMISELVT
jgi:hypothetical protein